LKASCTIWISDHFEVIFVTSEEEAKLCNIQYDLLSFVEGNEACLSRISYFYDVLLVVNHAFVLFCFHSSFMKIVNAGSTLKMDRNAIAPGSLGLQDRYKLLDD
jgi:hypothetical protein